MSSAFCRDTASCGSCRHFQSHGKCLSRFPTQTPVMHQGGGGGCCWAGAGEGSLGLCLSLTDVQSPHLAPPCFPNEEAREQLPCQSGTAFGLLTGDIISDIVFILKQCKTNALEISKEENENKPWLCFHFVVLKLTTMLLQIFCVTQTVVYPDITPTGASALFDEGWNSMKTVSSPAGRLRPMLPVRSPGSA